MLIWFLFLIENICCGYSLEAPHRGASNEYHNICINREIRKILCGYPPLSVAMAHSFSWKVSSYCWIKTWKDNTPPLSCHGETTLSKLDQTYPIVISNQISTISMHISSLVKIHCELLKLLSWNEGIEMSQADNTVKNWPNLPISNPEADVHKINAHTKFGENPLIFTQVIIRKQKIKHVAGR